MLYGNHAATSVKLLTRQCARQVRRQSPYTPWLSRGYHADSINQVRYHEHDIGVIGGGITGLSTAYWVTKKFPKSKVTIYATEDRLGGWLQSEEVEVEGGSVLFERGPRTLRLAGANHNVTLDMVEKLDLHDQLHVTLKDAPASKNRYIFYPNTLVKMPHPEDGIAAIIWQVLTQAVFKGVPWGALNEPRVPPRDDAIYDESVGDFIKRRVGEEPANNLASAIFHGIYAGSIWNLSAKSLLSRFWKNEKDFGSLFSAIPNNFKHGALLLPKELAIEQGFDRSEKLDEWVRGGSVFSFKEGIQQFSTSLSDYLRQHPNVTIKTGSPVTSIRHEEKSTAKSSPPLIQITTAAEPTPRTHDYVISTIYSRTLNSLIDTNQMPTPSNKVSSPLNKTPAATVMVVNFYFSIPHLIDHKGFGYLIPLSVPYENNPERALGVIFDSDAIQGQDTAPGTKLTVMMGGHYWENWTTYPSPREATEMALRLLRRHLGPLPNPEVSRATLQRDCIPQYTVGHYRRMGDAHNLLQKTFGGRLRVAGNSYTGVGVHDCTAAAMWVVEGLDEQSNTGLEDFAEEPKWIRMQIAELKRMVARKRRGNKEDEDDD